MPFGRSLLAALALVIVPVAADGASKHGSSHAKAKAKPRAHGSHFSHDTRATS